MFNRILVPTDFSTCSQAALDLARTHFPEAVVILLHVIEPKRLASDSVEHMVSPINMGEIRQGMQDVAKGKLGELAGPNDEVLVVVGDPAEKILLLIDELRPEVVVMGTHGRKGLAHLLIGSVAEHVVRSARVPVLVTKER